MYLPIQITSDNKPGVEIVEGLLDSGASGKFIDSDYATDIHAEKKELRKPIQVYNVDGTPNKLGTITQYVDLYLTIHERKRKHRLFVTGLGNQQIILGFPWLKEMNLLIDWEKGTLEWRKWKYSTLKKKEPKQQDGRTVKYYTFVRRMIDASEPKKQRAERPPPVEQKKEENEPECSNPMPGLSDKSDLSSIISTITGKTDNDVWINAKQNKATEIQAEINLKKKSLPLEEQIPKEFHKYLDVFSEEKAARFPEPKKWDHKIELKDTFTPKSFKTYNLTPAESIKLDKFLKDNLDKGYIQPSQSPMASPFFFVNKKDGKLRPCQDYRYLNEHTVKNAYPLPLISELLDKLKGAKRFTKLDVRWGYNNVHI